MKFSNSNVFEIRVAGKLSLKFIVSFPYLCSGGTSPSLDLTSTLVTIFKVKSSKLLNAIFLKRFTIGNWHSWKEILWCLTNLRFKRNSFILIHYKFISLIDLSNPLDVSSKKVNSRLFLNIMNSLNYKILIEFGLSWSNSFNKTMHSLNKNLL